MAVGIKVEKAQIDEMAGTTARALKVVLDRARLFKEWLDTQTEADLVTFGYSQSEAALIKAAFDDIATFADNFDRDGRGSARRLWGMGVLSTAT